jgi:DNA-directed RNA polymerase specialized sigma24 family protein
MPGTPGFEREDYERINRLLRDAAKGDQNAANAFFAATAPLTENILHLTSRQVFDDPSLHEEAIRDTASNLQMHMRARLLQGEGPTNWKDFSTTYRTALKKNLVILKREEGERRTPDTVPLRRHHAYEMEPAPGEEELQSRRKAVTEALRKIPREHRQVIRDRFYGDRTLQKIADSQGISRQAAQRKEGVAIGKLRHPHIMAALKDAAGADYDPAQTEWYKDMRASRQKLRGLFPDKDGRPYDVAALAKRSGIEPIVLHAFLEADLIDDPDARRIAIENKSRINQRLLKTLMADDPQDNAPANRLNHCIDTIARAARHLNTPGNDVGK